MLSIKPSLTVPEKDFLSQFIKYSIVGGISAVIDISIFHIIANVMNLNHIFANTMAFIAGIFVNFFLSRNWVFNKNTKVLSNDFVVFTIIGVIGVLLSNLILYVLIDLKLLYNIIYSVTARLGEDYIKLMAKAIAVFIVLFWNFIVRKKFVFEKKYS